MDSWLDGVAVIERVAWRAEVDEVQGPVRLLLNALDPLILSPLLLRVEEEGPLLLQVP